MIAGHGGMFTLPAPALMQIKTECARSIRLQQVIPLMIEQVYLKSLVNVFEKIIQKELQIKIDDDHAQQRAVRGKYRHSHTQCRDVRALNLSLMAIETDGRKRHLARTNFLCFLKIRTIASCLQLILCCHQHRPLATLDADLFATIVSHTDKTNQRQFRILFGELTKGACHAMAPDCR